MSRKVDATGRRQTVFRANAELLSEFQSRLAAVGKDMTPVLEGWIRLNLSGMLPLPDQVSQETSLQIPVKNPLDFNAEIPHNQANALVRELLGTIDAARQYLQSAIGELDRVVGEIGGAGGGSAVEDGGNTPESSAGAVSTENPDVFREAEDWRRDSEAITGGDAKAKAPPKKRTTKPA